MKITSISIENFRSIKNETIQFPENGILALVGPNNAGKSNILRAIDNLLGDSWFSGDRAELNDFYQRDKSHPIKIEINLTEESKVYINTAENSWATFIYKGHKVSKFNPPLGLTGNIKEDYPCTYLAANRNLEQSLQFRSYDLMGKIARKFQDKAITSKDEIEDKFNQIIDILNKVPGFKKFQDDFVSYFDELQTDSPYRLQVNFKAFSPLNYFKTLNILANDTSINSEYDIDTAELGDGNKSLLLFSLIRSYAKNFKTDAVGILAIEEPEIYLHPQARRHLFEIFKEITSTSSIQIIYTTHSPDFISTENFPSIGVVRKDPLLGTLVKMVSIDDLVTKSLETGVPKEKVNNENIADFYANTSNATTNEAFFATRILLVEGDTETLSFPLIFNCSKVSLDKSGISVIQVGGKNQIPKYWRLFHAFEIPVTIFMDYDDVDSNKQILDCFDLEKESISQGSEPYKIMKLNSTAIVIFYQDFESYLRSDFGNDSIFNTYYSEAVDLFKPKMKNGKPDQLKGQIARFTLRKLISINNYKPSFIDDLLNQIDIVEPTVSTTPTPSSIILEEDLPF